MPDEIRLALIMGGGVSLGAYTAGALTEMYHAIQQLNPPGNTTVRVEVLVGASAGSMTAALFAKALACNDPAVTEVIHDAWVNQIDISKLAPPATSEFNALSILMPDVIQSIATAALTAPESGAPWTYAADTLKIAFTGTNIGGIPLAMDYAKRDGAMTFDDHADAFFFETGKSDSGSEAVTKWAAIGQAAITSGAFPAAFPPRAMSRMNTDRPYTDFELLQFPNGTTFPQSMWFCDGGVFDNEPIGLAKRLVEGCDDYRKPGIEYRYVVIDHDLSRNTWRAYAPPDSLVAALGGVAGAIMEQGVSKDYLRATTVNNHAVSQRVAAGGQLRPLIDAASVAGTLALQGLATKIATTLEQTVAIHFFSADDKPSQIDIAAKVSEQRVRVLASPDYASALSGLGGVEQAVLVDAIVISEATAGLLDKHFLDINIVAPPAPALPGDLVLAGAFLWNFGGFFERVWRQHDFDCGRRDAKQTLTIDMMLDYPPDPNANYTPVPVQSGVKYVSSEDRANLLTYLTNRIAAIIRPPLDGAEKAMGFFERAGARAVIPRLPGLLAKGLLGAVGLGD